MRYFDAATIRARLPWPRMLAALDAMLQDDVAAPLRTNHAVAVPGESAASLLLMPAWRTGRRIGVKLVTVFPGNARRGQRTVGAVYALFDARDGVPLALFDGEEITARESRHRVVLHEWRHDNPAVGQGGPSGLSSAFRSHLASPADMNWSMMTWAAFTKSPNWASQSTRASDAEAL